MRPRHFCTLPAAVAFLLTAVAFDGATSLARAQDSVRIQFSPGTTSATINGTIVGNEYIDYVLGARAGQTMVVSLAVTGTNGNGTAFFNIVPAGQDFPALYNGSSDTDRRAEVTLPETRDWAVRVYLMGNDADTGRTVGYSIDVYIAPGGGSQGGGSAGSGADLLPEEDFFVVRTSGGPLNVRDAPRASAPKIGEHRNGTVLRNVGGCTVSDGQQWCQVQASSGGVIGWVAARFLGLPGPGDQGSGAAGGGGSTVRVAGVPVNDVLNVRSGPGTGNNVVGALANGDMVRMLSCQNVGSARWCEIEMQTDMRERGWVNARYLQ
ncbi:SH3 domain-containing protein [Rhodobacterales bacterium HKCCE3408]|nr:SH3 domain-containing protein [Rhodobacterales bacterium HKCCE3408]